MSVSIIHVAVRAGGRSCCLAALATAMLLMLVPAPARAVDWDGGAGSNWWYNPLNWSGNTQPTLADTGIFGASVVFDPAADPSAAGYQYTGIAPYVRGYAVNNPAQLNVGGFNNAPALPYPSPNTNYVPVNGANDALFLPPGPTGYQNPQSSTYVTGKLTLAGGANLAVNSGYLYVASNNNWPAGQNFDFNQDNSLLVVGSGVGTSSTLTQNGGTVDMRHGGLLIATSSSGGISGTYDYHGGYLVAGTHTGNYGSPYYGGARTGNNGPQAGNTTGTPNNSAIHGLQMGNGGSATGSALTTATFISRHEEPGAIWVQTLQTNRTFDADAKSTSTFEFHYGEDSTGHKSTTPIMIENGIRFGTPRTALDLATAGDRRTILDFRLDTAPDLVSDGLGGLKPEDVPLFRLGTGQRDGTGGISLGVNAFTNFIANTGVLIDLDRQIGFLQSPDLAPNGRPVLFMENVSSLTPAQFSALNLPGSPSFADRDLYITDVITRTLAGIEYTWKLSYFGSIDANGNVVSGGQGTNDIVLVGISAIAVPEPGSVILLGLGATGLWLFRRRRKSRRA